MLTQLKQQRQQIKSKGFQLSTLQSTFKTTDLEDEEKKKTEEHPDDAYDSGADSDFDPVEGEKKGEGEDVSINCSNEAGSGSDAEEDWDENENIIEKEAPEGEEPNSESDVVSMDSGDLEGVVSKQSEADKASVYSKVSKASKASKAESKASKAESKASLTSARRK
jgi:hypothetical protein